MKMHAFNHFFGSHSNILNAKKAVIAGSISYRSFDFDENEIINGDIITKNSLERFAAAITEIQADVGSELIGVKSKI